jgi:branched-chain amino acid transport system substrate-binding protein
MTLSRRGLIAGTAGGLSTLALARPGSADTEPLRIGWLAARTGPSSVPAIGFDRGVHYVVDAINAGGGIKGRKIELVVRDSEGDPTKVVNAVQDMISRAKVHAIYGPTNSGEALATTAIMARAKMPNLHAGFVDSLIDPEKYRNAFRVAPSDSQINEAVSGYCLDILKLKDTGSLPIPRAMGRRSLATMPRRSRSAAAEPFIRRRLMQRSRTSPRTCCG